MDVAARQSHGDPPPVIFEDGLGQRSRLPDAPGISGAEVLILRPSFATVPSFEFALRERAGRLASFRHASYARVRSIDRSTGLTPLLRVVSESGNGLRLSDVLAGAHAQHVPIDINAALCLVRQLVPAVAMLQESARDVAHGALAPERLVVTPQARLQIVEYVLGAALEQLRYSREQYWSELRVALPAGTGAPRFDHRADVLQIGIVALSLILGRTLRAEEFPGRIGDIVASTWAVSARGGFEPLPPGLRGWLGRALQIDQTRSFLSAVEARAELDIVLGDSELVASPASLEAFLARYHASAPAVEVPRISVSTSPAAEWGAESTAAPPMLVRNDPPTPSAASRPATESTVLSLAAPTDDSPLTQWKNEGAGQPAQQETQDSDDDFAKPRWWRNWRLLGAAAAVVAVVAAGSSLAARRPAADTAVHPASGTLEISTNPAGVETLVDGVARGATPLVLALEPGMHSLELRGPGQPRTIPITINPGMKVSQYVELSQNPAATELASLTPAPAPDPAPQVAPATSAAVIEPPREGFITLDVPFDVQVFEAGSLVGSGRDRLTLPPGRHALDLVNGDLGVRVSVIAQVAAGRTASVAVPVPDGVLSLNAQPWAEVWLDGEKAGETPLGNLQVRVGKHDVVFRHPDLGERHIAVTVTAKEPSRLSVDFRSR
jgi:hypothetical protein